MKRMLLAALALAALAAPAVAQNGITYSTTNPTSTPGYAGGTNQADPNTGALPVDSGAYTPGGHAVQFTSPASQAAVSVDGSGTQTTGGTAQALFGGVAPSHGYKIAIPSASQGNPCWLSDTTTTPSATTAGSYPVFPQGQYSSEPGEKPSGPIYLNCPTTGQVFSAKEW